MAATSTLAPPLTSRRCNKKDFLVCFSWDSDWTEADWIPRMPRNPCPVGAKRDSPLCRIKDTWHGIQKNVYTWMPIGQLFRNRSGAATFSRTPHTSRI